MITIALVADSRFQLQKAAPAALLFDHPLTRLAVKYCERFVSRYYIASAEYGLLEHNGFVGPYATSLKTMTLPERTAWGARVKGQMDEVGLGWMEFEPHLSTLHLVPLRAAGVVFGDSPVRGMNAGERLTWYLAQLNIRGKDETCVMNVTTQYHTGGSHG